MADLPISNTSNHDNITQQISSESQRQIPADSALLSRETVPSQILSKTAHKVILSLPNQPPLKLDISQNESLKQTLSIGDKVNLSFVKDASTVVITITPDIAKQGIELEVPLSKSLQSLLIKETSLPKQESVIKAHIEQNTLLPVGQARRLPNEKITLKVNETTTIKAPLPGVSALALNQTFQANLALNSQKQLTVQFTKLSVEAPRSQIIIPIPQLITAMPNNSLAGLPINQVTNISEIVTQPNLLTNQLPLPPVIDMAKPINQLWLRHQNSSALFTQLTNNVNTLFSVSNEQIRSEINITQNSLHTKINNELIVDPSISNNTQSRVKSDVVINEVNAPIIDQKPTAKPIVLPELALSKTNEQLSNKPVDVASNTSSTRNLVNDSPDKKIVNTPLQSSQVEIKNSPNTTSLPLPIDKGIKSPASNIVPPTVDNNMIKPAELTSKESIKNPVSITQSLNLVFKADINVGHDDGKTLHQSSAKELVSPASIQILKGTTDNITKVASDVISKITPEPPKTSLPLQKLNELINVLQSQTASTQPANKSHAVPPIELGSSLPTNAQTTVNTPAVDADLIAINQLKSLSKQVTSQLPSMPQLTNPAQLSQLIEQFTRFEPLNTQNIATQTSTLGPLANALQLLLGGRSAAQGPTLSPQLRKHLATLLKQPPNSNNSNHLNTALQMLGNLQSIKPLEESLTNLSSHIQFYQYQNVEQQQNNQSLFYFNMPTKEPNVPQIEGEVEENNAQDGKSEKSWRLTLLLPCGDNEKIKVNALLSGVTLELDLTCNNKSLVQRADFYLDFLTNRLESLGFDKLTVNCQEGEIPETLVKRPNQLVEIRI